MKENKGVRAENACLPPLDLTLRLRHTKNRRLKEQFRRLQ